MLTLNEIYSTVLGESLLSGRICTIVRLSGCQHKCSYCDSFYSHSKGRQMDLDELLGEVRDGGCRLVLITGGEPLQQPEVVDLMASLMAAGHQVALETSGTLCTVKLMDVPSGVRRIVDIKTPGSGVDPALIDWSGISGLGLDDEIKIVCRNRQDYEWARDLIREGTRLPDGICITLSASYGELPPHELAEWILGDRLDVRMQIQLHKILWPDRERGV